MQAAEQGDASALNNLGCMYLVGDGVEETLKKHSSYFINLQKSVMTVLNIMLD